jgi:arsenate reductase
MIIYGLKNCDTCRKALKYFKDKGWGHQFVDVRADGVPDGKIAEWMADRGWKTLLNTKSTTWRQLDEAQKQNPDDAKAAALINEYPTLMKRPVFQGQDKVIVGFKTAQQKEIDDIFA